MLFELRADEYPQVLPLFSPAYPNLAFVHAVVAQTIPGRVFVHPRGQGIDACLVTTGAPFCFAAGDVTPALLDEMRALLAQRPPVKLVHPPQTPSVAPSHGFVAAERLQFGQPPDGAAPVVLPIPPGFTLVPIDAALFPELNWKDTVLAIFGSAENYLASSFGYCLLHEGRLVAESYGVVGGGLVEPGCYVHPAYRRQDLSAIVTAAVSRHGAARGLRTVTTCDAHKDVSIALSLRIGLRLEFRYPISDLPA